MSWEELDKFHHSGPELHSSPPLNLTLWLDSSPSHANQAGSPSSASLRRIFFASGSSRTMCNGLKITLLVIAVQVDYHENTKSILSSR
jgi:hypothetical protein